ncbi:MAG: DNA/RNA nuclease SfsA [Humidesulfovibrio sp.]|nr:DNA/RNA nuclease SfsA [Humidesulfovibrio sp.]
MCDAVQALLPFPPGCRVTRLVGREKRFTAVTVDPDTGAEVRAHTNNTGSMLGLLRPGAAALLSPAANPDRVLKWTLEALALPGGHRGRHPAWVGVNTLTPNRLLAAAWRAGLLPETRAYAQMTPEAKTGASRLDARFDDAQGGGLPTLFVECKNVTLVEDDQAQFPDAASERGRKHLDELTRLVRQGCRAALFFLVQRPDGQCFAPAETVDPDYAAGLATALHAGVEAWVWRARVTPAGIALAARLPLAPAWAACERPRSA